MLRGPAPALAVLADCLGTHLRRFFFAIRFLLVFAVLLSAASVRAQNIATIKSVTGPVTVTHGNSRVSTAAGNSLQLNEIVHTGAKAGLRLVLLDGSELNLGSNTELRVILHNVETQQTTIEMLCGHLRATVTRVTKQGGSFQVHTPTTIAVALGTVFQVDAPLVDTTATRVGENIDSQSITNLPLSGRDPSQLVNLTPGTPANQSQPASSTILDGSRTEPDAGSMPLGFPIDARAVSEIEVSRSPLSLLTRNGTNAFRGTAYKLGQPIVRDRSLFFINFASRDVSERQFVPGEVSGSISALEGHSYSGAQFNFQNLRTGQTFRVPSDSAGGFRTFVLPGPYNIRFQEDPGSPPISLLNGMTVTGGSSIDLGNVTDSSVAQTRAPNLQFSPTVSASKSMHEEWFSTVTSRLLSEFVSQHRQERWGFEPSPITVPIDQIGGNFVFATNLPPTPPTQPGNPTDSAINSYVPGQPTALTVPLEGGYVTINIQNYDSSMNAARYTWQRFWINPDGSLSASHVWQGWLDKYDDIKMTQYYLNAVVTTASLEKRPTAQTVMPTTEPGSTGATPVYGSNAVSAVVNYIMRKDFEGLRLDAPYDFSGPSNAVPQSNATSRVPGTLNFRIGSTFNFNLTRNYSHNATPISDLPQGMLAKDPTASRTFNFDLQANLGIDFRLRYSRDYNSDFNGNSFAPTSQIPTLRFGGPASSSFVGGGNGVFSGNPSSGKLYVESFSRDSPEWAAIAYFMSAGQVALPALGHFTIPKVTSRGDFIFNPQITLPSSSSRSSRGGSPFGGFYDLPAQFSKSPFDYAISSSRFGPDRTLEPNYSRPPDYYSNLELKADRNVRWDFAPSLSYGTGFRYTSPDFFANEISARPLALSERLPAAQDAIRYQVIHPVRPYYTWNYRWLDSALSLYSIHDSETFKQPYWSEPYRISPPSPSYDQFLDILWDYGREYATYSDYRDFLDYLDYYGIYYWAIDDILNWDEGYSPYSDFSPSAWYSAFNQFYGDYFKTLSIVVSALNAGVGNRTKLSTAPSAPARLTWLGDFPPGSLSKFKLVAQTTVTSLDNGVGVLGNGSGVPRSLRILNSLQSTVVPAGGVPGDARSLFNPAEFAGTPRVMNVSSKSSEFSQILTSLAQFENCTPTVFVNGVLVQGNSGDAKWELTGTGSSTPLAKIHIVNYGKCTVIFIVTNSAVVTPSHVLKDKVGKSIFGAALGLATGGEVIAIPDLKELQDAIVAGKAIFVWARAQEEPPLSPKHGGGKEETGPEPSEVTVPVRSFCLDLHKLAPHPKTAYKFADENKQRELGPYGEVSNSVYRAVISGEAKLPPGESVDLATQWTLWAMRQRLDAKKFTEEYLHIVEMNLRAHNKKLDKETKQKMEDRAAQLFSFVQHFLPGAPKS